MRSAILFCLFVVFCVSSAFAAVRPMQASSAASSVSASASAAPSTDADLIHPEHRRQVARLVTTANSLSHSLRAALDTCAAEDRACTIEDFRNLGPQMAEMRNAVTDFLNGLVAQLLSILNAIPVLGPLLAGVLQPLVNVVLQLVDAIVGLLTGGQ